MRLKEESSSRVEVKFHDSVNLPYEDGAEAYLVKRGIVPWDELAREAPGLSLRRMFRSIPPDRIRALVERAAASDPTYCPPNLLTYFVVDVPPGVEPEAVVRVLRQWPAVEAAYVGSVAEDAGGDPADNPLWPDQGYLDPAPGGIDAEYAWTVPGGDGTGQAIIAVEMGVAVDHEDLSASVLYGEVLNTSMHHGTATVGIYSMLDNNTGGIGIAPAINYPVNVVCHDEYIGSPSVDYPAADVILQAIASLSYGGVIEIAQDWEINPSESGDGQTWESMPVEAHKPIFDVINLATTKGIVVVEAAGQGQRDLDTYTDNLGNAILNRDAGAAGGFRDSGAIMVSGATSVIPHVRGKFTNFGSRIDCYAWGQNITTSSWDPDPLYITNFGGTSGASAIIAGAALSLQGMVLAQLGWKWGSPKVRETLSDPDLGTKSANWPTDKIGVMPDLKKIAADVATEVSLWEWLLMQHVKFLEWKTIDPHVHIKGWPWPPPPDPLVMARIREVVKAMRPEVRRDILARAKATGAYAEMLEEVLSEVEES